MPSKKKPRATGKGKLLAGVNAVPWAKLQHAYGAAKDVPGLLRKLLVADPKVRSATMDTLYGNVFHQGTRFPAAPHVVPFLIELCASPAVPDRGQLLVYWGSLITGYFSVQERPTWGDGERIYMYGEVDETEPDPADCDDDPALRETLHAVYRESLAGHELLVALLDSDDVWVRAGAAWVLACLPTRAAASLPGLQARVGAEASGWVRAAIAFAFGELGAPLPLRRMLADDDFPAVRCMAACQLARIDPGERLLEPLLHFVADPIDGYEELPGAGGKSTGDAAFSISHLSPAVQRRAVPAICDRLETARSFDTVPLCTALLSAGFDKRNEPLQEVSELQRWILTRMVATSELWPIGNLSWLFPAHGLPFDRARCAALAGAAVTDDEALAALRSGLAFADIGFLEKGRDGILAALAIDPAVFDRAPAPEECWLLCAKAFAETDAQRAIEAFRRARAINPAAARRVNPTWRLADVLAQAGEPKL